MDDNDAAALSVFHLDDGMMLLNLFLKILCSLVIDRFRIPVGL